jgi:hypothetical protein
VATGDVRLGKFSGALQAPWETGEICPWKRQTDYRIQIYSEVESLHITKHHLVLLKSFFFLGFPSCFAFSLARSTCLRKSSFLAQSELGSSIEPATTWEES